MIGAGRLGASLALALRARGAALAGFTAATPAGRAKAEGWLGGRAASTFAELVACHPDLHVIAVPDQALPEVAAELGMALAEAESVRSAHALPLVVAHTSGATSVAVLAPCEQAGAATLVFHPLQTFPDPVNGAGRFAGAAIAITPSVPGLHSPAAVLGFAIARLLGARPFVLADDKRGLYHAAATFASNYLVTLEHHAKKLFVESGLPEHEALSLFLPLVGATLDNIAAQGTVKALTGPLSRGDTLTIASHLEALATCAPHLLPVYRALGLATLDIVEARGEVDSAVIAELSRLLQAAGRPAETGERLSRPGA